MRARHYYEFGPFRLDVVKHLLLRDGEPIPLTQKAFETLLAFVRNGGNLLNKGELMNSVWPDACVEEANLTQNIFTLRKALGERGKASRYIETVPRRGYRFIADVREVRDEKAVSVKGPNPPAQTLGEAEEILSPKQTLNSLAVLPFVNGSADPHAEYLSDGITESIINHLSQLSQLRVVNRSTAFRYKGREVDPQAVGQELGVQTVLTGRVLQLGDRLIIRAELIDAINGWQLWGEQFHRKLTDVLVVQKQISEELFERLQIKLTGEESQRLTKRYTEGVNVEAYQLYLKGRYHWTKYANQGLKKSIEYFQQAIAMDPTYALAYAGLADSYYRLSNTYLPPQEAMPKAKAAALKALEIDDTLAEAYIALGLIRMAYDRDWAGAEVALRRAIELNPNYAIARQRLGLLLTFVGRADEALCELQAALALDPLSLQASQCLALSHFLTRRYEEAAKQVHKELEMDAQFLPAHYLLGWIYVQTGDYKEAVAEFQKARDLDDAPMFMAALGYAYAVMGEHGAARAVIRELAEQAKEHHVPSYSTAVIYAGLGERAQAFAWLERAYEERSEMLALLKVCPELDNLRADLRFADLLQRVGLHRDDQVKQRCAG